MNFRLELPAKSDYFIPAPPPGDFGCRISLLRSENRLWLLLAVVLYRSRCHEPSSCNRPLCARKALLDPALPPEGLPIPGAPSEVAD